MKSWRVTAASEFRPDEIVLKFLKRHKILFKLNLFVYM